MSVGQSIEESDSPIDAKARTEIVNSLLAKLNTLYVFPEVATKIQDDIQQRLAKKEYDTITSSKAFAKLLTTQLQLISHDKHLGLHYQNKLIQEEPRVQKPTPEEVATRQQFAHEINFGFEKIDRLSGNIGYLRLDGFMPTGLAAETATAAMTYLAYTKALIIDLRQNGGGDPSMVSYLASYFFGPDSVHLNDLYWRDGNHTQQFWTLSHVQGQRYLHKPVYILTSDRTFSAGEEFAYDLQSLKRATIIGETTGGGANPGGPVRITEHLVAFIPTGRAINPITQTNWEGTGVKPDVATAAAEALKTAHIAALEKIRQTATEDQTRNKLTQFIDQVRNTK